jgi:hypothetical protein
MEKIAASVQKIENTAIVIRCADRTTPSILKFGTDYVNNYWNRVALDENSWT